MPASNLTNDTGVSTLSSESVADLVHACSTRSSTGLRNRALITMFYRGGLRVSEAQRMCAEHIDFHDRSVEVMGSGRTRRISLDPGSFFHLEAWINRRAQLSIDESSVVFSTLRGAPLSASYIRGMFRRLASRAGIDRSVSAAMLRRTLAVELATEGFSLSMIQGLLGHASPVTTVRLLEAAGSRIQPALDVRRTA